MVSFKNFLSKQNFLLPLLPMVAGGTLLTAALVGGHRQAENKPPEQTATVASTPETQGYQFSHPTIEKFLGGIAKAEHRGLENIDHKKHDPRLMIRTGAGKGSSSAYGPYQITRNLARGLVTNDPSLFAPIKDFANAFIAQGSRFLKANNNDPIYGLRGKGTLHGPEYLDDHLQLGDLAIQRLTKEKKINYQDGFTPIELNTMIRTWRGVSEREDPEYYKIVRSHYFSE